MKRVKIMLTAISVLAVVGGAVAFKAAKFGGQAYCTAPAGSSFCPTKILSRSFVAGSNLNYRQINVSVFCTATTICTGLGDIIN